MESVICDFDGDPRGWRMVLVPASKPGVDWNLITLTVSGKDIRVIICLRLCNHLPTSVQSSAYVREIICLHPCNHLPTSP